MSDNMDMPIRDLDELYDEDERVGWKPSPAFPRMRGTIIKREAIWVDGAGREIPISEMDDSHIINCILMIEQKHTRLGDLTTRFRRTPKRIAQQMRAWEDSIRMFMNELDRRAEQEAE